MTVRKAVCQYDLDDTVNSNRSTLPSHSKCLPVYEGSYRAPDVDRVVCNLVTCSCCQNALRKVTIHTVTSGWSGGNDDNVASAAWQSRARSRVPRGRFQLDFGAESFNKTCGGPSALRVLICHHQMIEAAGHNVALLCMYLTTTSLTISFRSE